MTFAAVLAILLAIGPVLDLDAAAINAMAPLIHKQINEALAYRKGSAYPKIPAARYQEQKNILTKKTCYHFRCA